MLWVVSTARTIGAHERARTQWRAELQSVALCEAVAPRQRIERGFEGAPIRVTHLTKNVVDQDLLGDFPEAPSSMTDQAQPSFRAIVAYWFCTVHDASWNRWPALS